MDNSVKLHISSEDFGESLWATRTDTAGVYELDNFPISDVPYTSGDLVTAIKVDGVLEVTGVAEKRFESYAFKYSGQMLDPGDEGTELRQQVREYFERAGCHIEWLLAGYAGLAIPVGMSDAEIEKLIDGSPYPLEPTMDDDDD